MALPAAPNADAAALQRVDDDSVVADQDATPVADPVTAPPASTGNGTRTDRVTSPESERRAAPRDRSDRRGQDRGAAAVVSDPSDPVRTTRTPTGTLSERLAEHRSATLELIRDSADASTLTPIATPGLTAATKTTVEPVARMSAVSAAATPVVETAQPPAPRLVSGLLAAVGLVPFAANSPLAPAQSTPLLALLGWARRETDRSFTQLTQPMKTAQPGIATAAVVDRLPSRLESRMVGRITGPNITDRQNIYGTDLGIMWDGGTLTGGEFAGERFVHVAFGDTFSGPNMTGNWISNAIMISVDRRLSSNASEFLVPSGPAFQFIPGGQGLRWLFPREVTVIPTAGIHAAGNQYVNYMSVQRWGAPGSWTTNFSAISQYNAATDKWVTVPSTIRSAGWFRSSTPYRPGDQNFQQMAYVKAPAADGEPQYVYGFGTPSGRQGSVHLSRVTERNMTDLSKYEYWDGKAWVSSAAHAAPIIGDSTRSTGLLGFLVDWANNPNVFGGYLGGLFGAKTGGNVSEMSVQYNEYLGKYVILYGDGNNDIQMRIADKPEGPWSDPITLATSQQFPGLYAPMIHPWSGTGLLEKDNKNKKDTDEDEEGDRSTLYWNMSLWGPYNVYLMETDLSQLIRV